LDKNKTENAAKDHTQMIGFQSQERVYVENKRNWRFMGEQSQTEGVRVTAAENSTFHTFVFQQQQLTP
jgi:hypothetical protein